MVILTCDDYLMVHGKSLMSRLVGHSTFSSTLISIKIWGSILGLLAWFLYRSVPLGMVMTAAMTELAELALCEAYAQASADVQSVHGAPCKADGSASDLCVIGMGKLGARELNVSSDIDLIYVYEADGETSASPEGRGRISNQEYYGKLVRALYTLLGDTTSLQSAITNNAIVTFRQTNNGTYSSVMSGSGSLVKNSSGQLTLNAANTYGGGTTVNEGTLLLADSGSLGSNNASVFLTGGTLNLGTKSLNSGAFTLGSGTLTNGTLTATSYALTNAGTIAANLGGSGTLTKSGAGTATLSGSFSGTIAVNEGTLLLGRANQIGNTSAINLGGGTLSTGGLADQVGKLTVSANSSISGLVATSGSTSNQFLFSSVDLTSYATSSGSTLNLGSYGYNSTINISSTSYTTWSGYSTTSLNNFANKIEFGNSGLKAQINFNGTSGLTYVTAIPEPKVYVAMAMLVVLVGAAEYRRRRSAKSATA